MSYKAVRSRLKIFVFDWTFDTHILFLTSYLLHTFTYRKKAKNSGQFKGIVAGARKGAAAGSKNRIHKAYKKQK